ncbi:MAG: MarR family transcriptional regulator [Burkholderiales bacterium]|nr:MarR family transcriptional regulator [Burkholderiales bacterium]
MKAVIDIAPRGSVFKTARRQLKAAEAGARYGADCHLSFESARILFSELTPARIDLLEALRQCGPCSVYALAKETGRNYSNVHTDVAKLEEHGLVQRTPEDAVFVPFESVEIHLSLFRQAA